MGRTRKKADDSSSLLKRTKACLPDESYIRCVELLNRKDYGSVLLILNAAQVEAKLACQSAWEDTRREHDSLRERWRSSQHYTRAVNHLVRVNKAIVCLLKYIRQSGLHDPFMYAAVRMQ